MVGGFVKNDENQDVYTKKHGNDVTSVPSATFMHLLWLVGHTVHTFGFKESQRLRPQVECKAHSLGTGNRNFRQVAAAALLNMLPSRFLGYADGLLSSTSCGRQSFFAIHSRRPFQFQLVRIIALENGWQETRESERLVLMLFVDRRIVF